MIKQRLTYYITLLCTLLLSVSCSKEETPPADTGRLGEITHTRNYVGVNQKTMFACEVSVPQGALNVQIQWEATEGEALEPQGYGNGISYSTFAWKSAGDYAVKCKVSYTYASETKRIEKEMNLKVYPTDFQNSFIGDDIKTVTADNPGISEETGYLLMESDLYFHLFRFKDGVLRRGQTREHCMLGDAPDPAAAYNTFLARVAKFNDRFTEKLPIFVLDNGYEPTSEQKATMEKFTKGETLSQNEAAIVGTLINQGNAAIGVTLKLTKPNGEPFDVTISCENYQAPNQCLILMNYGTLR